MTRDSAITERPARRSVSVEWLTNNANSSPVREALPETATLYSEFPIPASFCTGIVALSTTIEQRACNAVRVIFRRTKDVT